MKWILIIWRFEGNPKCGVRVQALGTASLPVPGKQIIRITLTIDQDFFQQVNVVKILALLASREAKRHGLEVEGLDALIR